MARLTEYTTYADAQRNFTSEKLWELFDGDRDRLNLAHECIDRHALDDERVAVRVVRADGNDDILTFRAIADTSSRFAHWLEAEGIGLGDRVAVMLEPSLAFYAAVFGAIKRGAVAVPLFTLFGPEGVRLRVDDCRPVLLITNEEKWETTTGLAGLRVCRDTEVLADLARYPADYKIDTAASDLAAFQYTSGTTRALPEAVKHSHRAVVVVTNAALYATGVRPGDRFFCPSSPAWGHGMWHGTFAPLAMGVETGTFAGKFSPERMLEVLERYKITNLSAAATHYRMMMNCNAAGRHRYTIEKLSFTGEPLDSETAEFTSRLFGAPVCSIYGTTEIGVILAAYPGAADFVPKPGSLGKPVPGAEVGVVRTDGSSCDPDEVGEIKVRRRGGWIATRDRGWVDGDGYFFHAGRADDVIISAGYTIGAVEVEDVLLQHPDVQEAAVIGVPDDLRGHVVKAFLVSRRESDPEFVGEIQEFVRTRLSAHEYPRMVAVVASLPKTPAGKVNRQMLRDQEAVATEGRPSNGIDGNE
ncbi:MAG: acyl-CoA synthetase [Hyphomicrobiaceae bacterium]